MDVSGPAIAVIRETRLHPRPEVYLTQNNRSKVDAPLKEALPELGFVIEFICNPFRCMHPLQGTAFREGLVSKVSATRSRDTVQLLAVTKDVIGNAHHCGRQFDMRSCRQFCQASAPMSLIPDSTLTRRKRPAKAPPGTISSGFIGTCTASGT